MDFKNNTQLRQDTSVISNPPSPSLRMYSERHTNVPQLLSLKVSMLFWMALEVMLLLIQKPGSRKSWEHKHIHLIAAKPGEVMFWGGRAMNCQLVTSGSVSAAWS